MKKIVAILAVALIGMSAAFSAKAIEDPNPKGTLVVGAQVGVMPLGTNVFGDYVLVDSWWKGHFTVGGQVGLSTFGYGWGRYTYFDIAPRVTYGLNITNQFEVHVGVLSGIGFTMDRFESGDHYEVHNDFRLVYGGVTGVRFFFSDKFGATAEIIGAGHYSTFNAGIVMKF